ncbi:MAG TPA: dihydrodipicolinate synthase family protein [Acidimicrobiia bacterium]|nr:dihydrodipicolinate synthase family protein [Acidimicrobiia bacterium]
MTNPPRYLVALVTPFTTGGDLDLDAHRHNLTALNALGIDGFVIGGSNGEGPYLEPGERSTLVSTARETLGVGVHLMCGVMAETVRVGTRQLAEAHDAGANSVLCLTPTTLTRNRPEAVERYFTAMADASKLPLMLYSVPNTTAFNLGEDIVARLATHANIGGMKDSSGDPVRMQRMVYTTPDDFLFWSGSSQALTLAITAGAYGVINGAGNYVPALVLETLAMAMKDPIGARELQERLASISVTVETKGIAAVKAASVEAGLHPGHVRAPLADVSEALAAELREAVRAI